MTRPDPGEPSPEILERTPGRWSAALSFLGRLPWAQRLPQRLPRWLMPVTLAILLAGGSALVVTTVIGDGTAKVNMLSAQPVAMPYICRQYIGEVAPGTAGFKVVLGDAAVPRSFIGPLSPSGNRSWPYWHQTEFLFHGSSPPVTISVPKDWRGRAAIFGQPTITVSTVHIPSCPPRSAWYVYDSAFYSRTRSACVPLQIQVVRRTVTAWFGLGRRCPAALG